MPRPSRRHAGGGEFTLPHNFAPRSYQVPVLQAMQRGVRRIMLNWHRKAGKDLMTLQVFIIMMVQRPGLYLHTFVDGVQARGVVWDGATVEGKKFLDFFPPEMVLEKNETEMSVTTRSAGELTSTYRLVGTEDANRLRGLNPIGIGFSEFSYQDGRAWEIFAPVLLANGGTALFNFTPQGRNHAYDLYQQALHNPGSWFAQTLTIDDTRRDAPGEDGQRIVTPEDLQAERDRGVDEDFIQQEYYCSFSGTKSGSYFGDALRRAQVAGRIGRVPWDPAFPVETWVDLGIGKNMAVWFVQSIGARVQVIEFFEGEGSDSVMELAKVLQAKPYTYSLHCWPHDAATKDIGSGRSRVDIAESLGVRPVEVVPKGSKADGITQAKALLEKCYFDEAACRRGLACLGAFHRAWDPKHSTWKDEPVSDWSTHAADAFRTGAMGTRGGVPLTARPIKVITDFNLNLGAGASSRNPRSFPWS